MNKTIASKIFILCEKNGSYRFSHVVKKCKKKAFKIERENGEYRFTFVDQSIITSSGDGIDFGVACCFAWKGDGRPTRHRPGCKFYDSM